MGGGGPTETCRLLQSDGVRKIPAHIPASLHFIGPWFLHLPLLPASRLTMSRLFWNLTSCAQRLNPGGTEFYKPPILETHTPLKKIQNQPFFYHLHGNFQSVCMAFIKKRVLNASYVPGTGEQHGVHFEGIYVVGISLSQSDKLYPNSTFHLSANYSVEKCCLH